MISACFQISESLISQGRKTSEKRVVQIERVSLDFSCCFFPWKKSFKLRARLCYREAILQLLKVIQSLMSLGFNFVRSQMHPRRHTHLSTTGAAYKGTIKSRVSYALKLDLISFFCFFFFFSFFFYLFSPVTVPAKPSGFPHTARHGLPILS